jgi:hypothetical protein
MSPIGPKATSPSVRFRAAVGVLADVRATPRELDDYARSIRTSAAQ